MKVRFPSVLLLLLLALAVVPLRAVEAGRRATTAPGSELRAALTAADDERVAAFTTGDRARLEAIFSDDLRYAHSNGRIDTKPSMIDTLVSHRSVYESFDYQERSFARAADGAALMSGRVIVHVRNGDQRLALDLNFLAVWREEHGRWRFLAWQSCLNPPPPAAAPGKR